MGKLSRQRAIKDLVAQRPITKQGELAKLLQEQGFKVSQATVSRDIAEIPLEKMRTPNGLVYHWRGSSAEPKNHFTRLMGEQVLSVVQAENLVVMKTGPALAAPVAIAIDEAQLELVLGTIAGDDTVLVVTKDKTTGNKLSDFLINMLT